MKWKDKKDINGTRSLRHFVPGFKAVQETTSVAVQPWPGTLMRSSRTVRQCWRQSMSNWPRWIEELAAEINPSHYSFPLLQIYSDYVRSSWYLRYWWGCLNETHVATACLMLWKEDRPSRRWEIGRLVQVHLQISIFLGLLFLPSQLSMQWDEFCWILFGELLDYLEA